MVLWGSKEPAPSSLTLSNINMSDRKLQPGLKVYRDPSPRPAMTTQWVNTQLAPEKVGNRQEDWRRERDMEKIRAKTISSDMDKHERYYPKDRTTAPRWREGEKESIEREGKRQEDDKSRHIRALMNVQRYIDREMESGIRKGETFPRMTNSYTDNGRRKMSDAANDEERGERRKKDKWRQPETYDLEKARERDRQRDCYRERTTDDIQQRATEEEKKTGRRTMEDAKLRQGDRYQELDSSIQGRGKEEGDSRDRRERYAARSKENPKLNTGGKGAHSPSPHRQRDREMDTYRREREKVHKPARRRDIRVEGDSVERQLRRVREGDRNRQGFKEDNGQRYRDSDREREVDRTRRKGVEEDRERYLDVDKRDADGARSRERGADFYNDRALLKDREDYQKYQEYRQKKYRKAREADLSWDGTTGRRIQPLNMTVARVPPRALSNEEFSNSMDSVVYRKGRGSYEERESGRESTAKTEQDVEGKKRHESDKGNVTGSKPGQRRMWLEPQTDKNSNKEFSYRERHKIQKERREEERDMDSQEKWLGEGRQVKDPDGHVDQYNYRGIHRGLNEYRGQFERETEEVNVDGDDVDEENDRKEPLSDSNGLPKGTMQKDDEGENAEEREGDKEEEGGSEIFTRVGSNTGWKLNNYHSLSAEDYATFSGDDDEEEREEEEDEELQDCPESWERPYDGTSPVDEGEQGTKRQLNYVFCVIGQTPPGSQHEDASSSDVDQVVDVETQEPEWEKCTPCSDDTTQQPQDDLQLTLNSNNEYYVINNQKEEDEAGPNASKEEQSAAGEAVDAESRYVTSSILQDTESGEEMRTTEDNSCAEVTEINRDLQTERLLIQWREKDNEVPEEQRDRPSPVPSNPYADVCSEVNLEQVLGKINTETLGSTGTEESAQVQMGKGWTMCEEPKRHSQAPHLKWAKNVVRDILGHSEEETMDEPHPGEQGSTEPETTNKSSTHDDELTQVTKEVPCILLTMTEQHSDPELQEEDSLEELRGMQQSQGGVNSERFSAMYDDTLAHTHSDTLFTTEGKENDSMDKETEPSSHRHLEKGDVEVKITREEGNEVFLDAENEEVRKKDREMYLSVGNTLYKPNSCPILNCKSTSELHVSFREGEDHEAGDRMGESEEEIQEEESKVWGTTAELGKTGAGEISEPENRQAEVVAEREIDVRILKSSGSFQELGSKARFLKRGIRKTAERRDGKLAEEEEEEGVGRDRRTRIFSTTDDEEDWSKTWGGAELKNAFNPFRDRKERKSKFFKRAQLYQQYNEAAQNLEILSQSGSDSHRLPEDNSHSPLPSPPPARRPLPPLPQVLHPHSIFHVSPFSSAKTLPLPEPPKNEGRPPSPRLSVSFSQSSTLWRDLPGVRDSSELAEINEDQRRLQEVQFEVLTSEASYCRSLDIVVEHFVKSKQLGTLLASQDRNWLFSRLADVRAISHSFLLKLEERVESNPIHFTVCDIIIQHCPRFRKVYVPYLTNQSYQDATYQRLMNENPAFKRIVEKLERNSVCERLPFRSFLVLPFQRITRLKLLVQNIVKRTTPGTTEATQAIKAMKLLEKVIQESNDSISQMKNIESLVSLNAKVDFECKTLPLVSQSRRLIRKGPVTELIDFSLKETERNAYLHLFNDFLLVSLLKEGGRFTVIDHSPVSELRVENCRLKLHTLQKNLFRLHMAHKSLLLRTETQSDKLRWISALSRPHPEVDFSAAQDLPQMQCIRAFVAQQPDEMSLDKADIILVHQKSSDQWVEGTRLPDGTRGWVPASNLEIISNSRAKQRNLSDALKLTTATAAV